MTEPTPPPAPDTPEIPATPTRRRFRDRFRRVGADGSSRTFGLAALVASTLAGVIVGGLGVTAVQAVTHDGPPGRGGPGWSERGGPMGGPGAPGAPGRGDGSGQDGGPGLGGTGGVPGGVPGQVQPTTPPEDEGSGSGSGSEGGTTS